MTQDQVGVSLSVDNQYTDIRSSSSQLTRHIFGETKVYDLMENGSSISVTKENRRKYIYSFMKYFLIDSIREQFQAFRNGFMRVCAGKMLVRRAWLKGVWLDLSPPISPVECAPS